MQGIPLFFYFTHSVRCNLSDDYLNDSFKEQWKAGINATANFLGYKNKAGDCCESITSDHFPFIFDLYLKYNTIKSFYAKSAMTGKKGEKKCFIRRKT